MVNVASVLPSITHPFRLLLVGAAAAGLDPSKVSLAEWTKLSEWAKDTGGERNADGSPSRAQEGEWKRLWELSAAQSTTLVPNEGLHLGSTQIQQQNLQQQPRMPGVIPGSDGASPIKTGFLKKNAAKDRTRPANPKKWDERFFVLTGGPRPFLTYYNSEQVKLRNVSAQACIVMSPCVVCALAGVHYYYLGGSSSRASEPGRHAMVVSGFCW
eukprot:SAG31_NODE_5696_length_2376_cov_1.384717_2_plen_213_part_00